MPDLLHSGSIAKWATIYYKTMPLPNNREYSTVQYVSLGWGVPVLICGITAGSSFHKYTVNGEKRLSRIFPLSIANFSMIYPFDPCFLCPFSKYLCASHTWKFLTLQHFLLQMPLLQMPLWKKSKNVAYPLSEHFERWVQNRPWPNGLITERLNC